jgi:predicted house-cleaning noncanonical NTP pyrophosphatase (MazG superfamily)
MDKILKIIDDSIDNLQNTINKTKDVEFKKALEKRLKERRRFGYFY